MSNKTEYKDRTVYFSEQLATKIRQGDKYKAKYYLEKLKTIIEVMETGQPVNENHGLYPTSIYITTYKNANIYLDEDTGEFYTPITRVTSNALFNIKKHIDDVVETITNQLGEVFKLHTPWDDDAFRDMIVKTITDN